MKLLDEKRINAVIDFIKEYQKEKGKSPSYSEIGRATNLLNNGTVQRYVKELVKRGLISQEPNGKIAIDKRYSSGSTKMTSMVGTVACGQPILAEENIECSYALPTDIFGGGELFLLRAQGYSMVKKGIYDKDILVARKQETAEKGQVVVALIGDEATVKTFIPKKDKVILRAENDATDENGNRVYKDIETRECRIIAVIDSVIHKMV